MNAQQIARLDLALGRGNLTGVTSTYHLLKNKMGAAAPTKTQISQYINTRPSVQVNKTTKSVAGKKNAIEPMTPPPTPLGWCASDCAFIPPACYNPADKKRHSAVCVFICGLTKFIYVYTCTLNSDDRPSTT